MKYRFTRSWATLTVGLGSVLIAAGTVLTLAIAADPWGIVPWVQSSSAGLGAWVTSRRPLLILVPLVAALGVGGSLVVAGQILHVFLDQRDLLDRQRTALRRIEERLEFWELVRTGREKTHVASLVARMKSVK